MVMLINPSRLAITLLYFAHKQKQQKERTATAPPLNLGHAFYYILSGIPIIRTFQRSAIILFDFGLSSKLVSLETTKH